MKKGEKLGKDGKPITSIYDRWLATEGIDVIRDYMVKDVRSVPLKPWKRKGGLGVHISLKGAEDCDAAYVCEIPPKRALKPQKHLFEEMILILSGGKGKTEVWNDDGPKVACNWQEGSLFAVPLNTRHQHFNLSDKPVRYLAVTYAPPVIDLFHNKEFIFNNPFVFRDRFNGQKNYFSKKGKLFAEGVEKIWDTNFVPNVDTVELKKWRERGGSSIRFELCHNTMISHISQFGVGTYKKAHRHAPGAYIVILEGEGYTLLWHEGQPKMKFDWQRGSLIVPGRMQFHQHFNTGTEPAKYLALRWGSQKYPTGLHFSEGENWWFSTRLGGNQIEYEDEDLDVRQMYAKELAKKGIALKLPSKSK